MAIDIMGKMGGMLPKATTVYTVMIVIVIALIIATLLSIAIWVYLDKKKYNKVIILHRIIQGKLKKVGTFRATFEKIGVTGDVWCRVKGGLFKTIKIVTRPKLEYEKNVYLFFERQDGEWVNFEIENIDEVMKKAGVFYLDEDMRLHRIGIQKNLERRLEKKTFWQEWGGTIMNLVFMLILTVCLIILFNKLTLVSDGLVKAAQAVKELSIAASQTCATSGSGIIPVAPTGVPI